MSEALRPAIVTGAARGIGYAVASKLVQEGRAVVLADVDAPALERARAKLPPDTTLAIACDVSSAADIARLVRSALDRFGPVHGLVSNAGIFPTSAFVDMSADEWERVIGVNLKGVFLCAQAIARQMIAHGVAGRIVNVSSTSSLLPRAGHAAYASSKAGLNALTRVMAVELADAGIHVNAVCPGVIASENIVAKASAPEHAGRYKAQLERVPLARMGTPEEIAELVVFLLGSGASYMTGAVITADGGYTCGIAR